MASSVTHPVKPHVVVLPFPAPGHMNPLMELSKRLASKGLTITFVVTLHNLTRILQTQNKQQQSFDPSTGEAKGMDIRMVGIPDGLPLDHERNFDPDWARAIMQMGAVFEELIQKLNIEGTGPVTCIISDSFLPWTHDIAKKFSIPRGFFWSQAASSFASFAYIPQIISKYNYRPILDKVKIGRSRQPMDLVSCIPGLPPLHPADLPFAIIGGDAGARVLADLIDVQFEQQKDSAWIIANSFYELESEVAKSLQMGKAVLFMGPMLHSSLLNSRTLSIRTEMSIWNEDECLDWLESQAPSSVVYISFGSVVTLSVAQIREIAMGLLSSQQHFLWVLRWNATNDEVKNLSEILPEGFLDSTQESGRIIRWAPQPQVLAHPAVGGFFSHGGWNSTLESMCTGTPMLVWPHLVDQFINCWLVVHKWKAGVEVEWREGEMVGREAVERGVREVMMGGEMRRRAEEVREAARKAMEGGGSSERDMEVFVNDMILRAQQKRENRVEDKEEGEKEDEPFISHL